MSQADVINIRQALRVFHKVCEYGEKQGEEYALSGLRASTDFDGYTVFLSSSDVNLTIHFHNKYDVDHKNRFALDQFIATLDKIDQAEFS